MRIKSASDLPSDIHQSKADSRVTALTGGSASARPPVISHPQPAQLLVFRIAYAHSGNIAFICRQSHAKKHVILFSRE